MAFIPWLCILGLFAAAWPSAMPFVMAYFVIGGMLGAGFHWAAHRHPDKEMAEWARPMALYVFYGWPIALVTMFIYKGKAKK